MARSGAPARRLRDAALSTSMGWKFFGLRENFVVFFYRNLPPAAQRLRSADPETLRGLEASRRPNDFHRNPLKAAFQASLASEKARDARSGSWAFGWARAGALVSSNAKADGSAAPGDGMLGSNPDSFIAGLRLNERDAFRQGAMVAVAAMPVALARRGVGPSGRRDGLGAHSSVHCRGSGLALQDAVPASMEG